MHSEPLTLIERHAATAEPAVRRLSLRLWQSAFGVSPLDAHQVAALNSAARMQSVPLGRTVFARGDPARVSWFVSEGSVALGVRDADGAFRTERVAHGPGWADLASAWLQGRHALEARVLTAAMLVELDPLALRDPLLRVPGLARHLIEALAREVQSLTEQTQDLKHKDAPSRFAAWLVQRADASHGGSPGVIRLGERKRDIAAQLAITPETLSRLIRSFTRRGVLDVAGYEVRVLDAPALLRLAQGEVV